MKRLLSNGITNGKITLTEVSSSIVRNLIETNHYSHKCTPNHFMSFDINNGMGAIQLGFGIKPRQKYTISKMITADNYCEFDRMWLSDNMPKNSESQVIGLLLSYLKNRHNKIKFVITYADGSVGNRGIIYQATNAIEIKPIMCDFYLLPNGERVIRFQCGTDTKQEQNNFLKSNILVMFTLRGHQKVQFINIDMFIFLTRNLKNNF